MKPLYLKFKGLNNYEVAQSIDFKKLTKQGLFGIFGPTGSGKSTILDAITLVLYGEISRKSKEFINTNSEEASVTFEFSLTAKSEEVAYRAERVYKRKKAGSYQCRYARVIRLGDEEEILAERPTEAKEQIIGLLGLTMDDFTRSVVLPQGKFSEFLKLKGRDRRVMLERIFGLEKYGVVLSGKLRRSYAQKKSEQQYKEGQLGRYQGITEEELKGLEEAYNNKSGEKKKVDAFLLKIEKEYEEMSAIWQQQEELKNAKEKLAMMSHHQETIKESKRRVEKANQAKVILPYIERYAETSSQLEATTKVAEELKEKHQTASQYLSKFKQELQELEIFERETLPGWHVAEKELTEAIQLKETLREYGEQTQGLQQKMASEETLGNQQQQAYTKELEAYNKLGRDIEQLEAKMERVKVDPAYRNRVEEGYLLFNQQEEVVLGISGKEVDIHQAENLYDEAMKKIKGLEGEETETNQVLIQKKTLLEEAERESLQLQRQRDASQEQVLTLKGQVQEARHEQREMDLASERLRQFQLTKKELMEELEILDTKIHNLDKELMEVNTIKEELQGKYAAAIIATDLEEGQPCPVCGSTHHVNKASQVDEDQLDRLMKHEDEIKEKHAGQVLKRQGVTLKLERTKEEIVTWEARLKSHHDKIDTFGQPEALKDQLKNLEESLSQVNEDIEKWRQKGKALQEKYYEIMDHLQRLRTTLAKEREHANQKVMEIAKYKKDLTSLEMKQEELDKAFQLLGLAIPKEAMKEIRNQLRQQEKDQEEGLGELKRKQSTSKELALALDKKKEAIQAGRIAYEKLKLQHENLEKDMKELRVKIDQLTKGQDPDEGLKALKENLMRYTSKAAKLRKNHQYSFEKEQEYRDASGREGQKVIQLQELLGKQAEDKKTQLESYDYTNEQQVKDDFMLAGELVALTQEVAEFEEAYKKTIGYLQNLEAKLGDKAAKEEEYEQCKQQRRETRDAKELLIKELSQLESDIKNMKAGIGEIKEILEEKKVIDHELALLEELTKLFKGNKFVEYVAKSQFRYIVGEASKRLYDLSGRYGIEVDDNGEFLIRDDRNGGMVREAATLSGGETFLTSLALALALSSHIQLNGSYPLEFFFLDEGFGTLDGELLDTVMESLEKLNNSQMTVGVISHVKELQNRVPVKLIVEPKEFEGSDIRLEYS